MAQIPNDVAEQLKALAGMSAPALRALWKDTFGRPHPGWVQKDFLVRALAYHVQEKALGGLQPAMKRRLLEYAREFQAKGRIAALERPRIKPGTRLVRGWGGDTHVVTVLDSGYEYRGKRYASLSEIARAITKTRWSGPKFFGLKAPPQAAGGPSRAAWPGSAPLRRLHAKVLGRGLGAVLQLPRRPAGGVPRLYRKPAT